MPARNPAVNGIKVLKCCFNRLKDLPILPNSLDMVLCTGNYEMKELSEYILQRFEVRQIPYSTYAKKIQLIWRTWIKIKRLKFCRQLHLHFDEYLYRPNNFGYVETKDKYKGVFADCEQ